MKAHYASWNGAYTDKQRFTQRNSLDESSRAYGFAENR